MNGSVHISKKDKQRIMKDIVNIQEKTGWPKQKIIGLFGLNRQRLNRWEKEKENPPRSQKHIVTRILPEEEESVIFYRTLKDKNRDLGYRKFTWTMVDNDVAFVSESAVYRILKRFNLLGKSFKPHDGAAKEYNNKPKYVHHHWHTDLAYVKLSGEHFYLVFMLDGYSRYIMAWELLTDMSSMSVELFTQKVLDKYTDVRPMVIHDNGVQFISYEFKNILSENNCIDVPTRIKHPETNGKAERFVGIVRQEALRPNSPSYYTEAVNILEQFVHDYNNNRYHAGINFLKPVDVFEGRRKKILDERKKKLAKARNNRIIINKQRHSKSENLPAYIN